MSNSVLSTVSIVIFTTIRTHEKNIKGKGKGKRKKAKAKTQMQRFIDRCQTQYIM